MSNEKRLTSVKLDTELYEEFKIQCLRDKFTLQKLTTRAIELYLNDKEFKAKVRTPLKFKKDEQ
jgi:hypothetical protein